MEGYAATRDAFVLMVLFRIERPHLPHETKKCHSHRKFRKGKTHLPIAIGILLMSRIIGLQFSAKPNLPKGK
jgi:hypothetical protein